MYKKTKDAFKLSWTLMVPLGNKDVVSITQDMRTTFTPNCNKTFTVGGVPKHHQLLKF